MKCAMQKNRSLLSCCFCFLIFWLFLVSLCSCTTTDLSCGRLARLAQFEIDEFRCFRILWSAKWITFANLYELGTYIPWVAPMPFLCDYMHFMCLDLERDGEIEGGPRRECVAASSRSAKHDLQPVAPIHTWASCGPGSGDASNCVARFQFQCRCRILAHHGSSGHILVWVLVGCIFLGVGSWFYCGDRSEHVVFPIHGAPIPRAPMEGCSTNTSYLFPATLIDNAFQSNVFFSLWSLLRHNRLFGGENQKNMMKTLIIHTLRGREYDQNRGDGCFS